MRKQSLDFDNSWKEAIEHLFESFMKFFFPKASLEIDWSKKYEFLDNEFRKLVEESRLKKSVVDKLVKVWLKDGSDKRLLIHLEIQNQKKSNFEQRMYNYHISIYQRYGKKVASMAILGDPDKNWKPYVFDYTIMGSRVTFVFPIVKLTDFLKRWDKLKKSRNPFAVMVMAHLTMLKSGKNVVDLACWKKEITKYLLASRLSTKEKRHTLKFIDVIVSLSEEKEIDFRQEIIRHIKEKKMTTTMIPWEKAAYKDGMKKGREKGKIEGKVEGKVEGLEEGLTQGRIEGILQALIDVLNSRFTKIPRSCLSSIKKTVGSGYLDIAA